MTDEPEPVVSEVERLRAEVADVTSRKDAALAALRDLGRQLRAERAKR
jgi:hypothetical protein